MKKFKSPVSAYSSGKIADPTSSSRMSGNDLASPRVKRKESHTAPTKFGMGDFYGTGHKNPLGRIRDSSTPGENPVSKAKLGKPPKSLA